jgi:hypothetical protein
MGDGIMALFGAPIAHEDHALRACYAALAMQAAMRSYTEEVRRAHGLEMRMRVGLNSGEVVVRAIGNDLHMDYSAVGETTHLAARMEQLATPGSIRLTPATLRLAEGLIQVTALGPVPVKGLGEPVDVFELVGAGPARTRLQAASVRGLTRFVGRDTELAALYQALAQAEAGSGQVVALVGEPGVGKSRLVYEGTRSHRTQGWLVLESSSVSYGKATPYFPVIDLLKAYCGIEAHDDARRRREKALGKVLSLDEALRPMLPAILALLEVSVDEPQWQTLAPPSAGNGRWTPSSGSCCVKARCSRCCWSARICTGLMPRRRPSSTAWSRACRRPACSCWSIIARNTSTPGAAKPTTRNSGSIPCPPHGPTNCCRPSWGTPRALHRSHRS